MNYKPSPLQVKLGESVLMESEKAESKAERQDHMQISVSVAEHAIKAQAPHRAVLSL